ncbi:MAG TPA: DoxX family protein [Candidatus Paceibacterota bacterium]|nr:DoxX family protein [Candidatus Paceibacterota bacterium]
MQKLMQRIQKIMRMLKPFSPVVLRIGIASVFLWFGFDQFIHTTDWIGYVPQSVSNLLHLSPITLVYMNGLFEITFGLALFLGFYTRFVAFLLALHLIDITFIVGYSAIGVRDFGLCIATIAIWLNGRDFLSLDRYMSVSADKS